MKSYMNIEYETTVRLWRKKEDLQHIDYKMSKEKLENTIAYLMTIYYETNDRDIEKINYILNIFNNLKKDTSNIIHIQL